MPHPLTRSGGWLSLRRCLFALPGLLIAPVAGFAQVTAVPVQSAPVVAAGASTPRTLAQRFADTVNVLDFGADPTGAADSQPACAAAIASVPAGTAVRLLWPHGTYRLNTGCVSNGRFVTADLVAGASVGSNYGGLGSGALYVTRSERMVGRQLFVDMQADNATGALGEARAIGNNSGAAAPGNGAFQQLYSSYATLGSYTTDIAEYRHAQWAKGSGGQLWGSWLTATSPILSAADVTGGTSFGLWGMELNVTNNGPDAGGWSEFDPASTVHGVGVPSPWSGGLVVTPDIWTPTGGLGGHGSVAYTVSNSGTANSRTAAPADPHQPASATGGYVAKWYSGYHVSNNAIAPGGRGLYAGGDTTGTAALFPYSPLEARHAWQSGIRLEQAAPQDGNALVLGAGHAIQWGTGATVARLTASGANLSSAGTVFAPMFYSTGAMEISNSGSNATLYVSSPAGTQRTISLQSSESNRWQIMAQNNAESGGNAGSDLWISAFADNGSYLFAPLVIARATGVATFTAVPQVGTAPVLTHVAVPASATAPCSVGQQASDAGYIYLCTATNTWKRAALAAW